jgi:hypothetical protein
MLLLMSGATLYPRSDTVGDLIIPRKWNAPETLTLAPGRWAMDNGCFLGFDPGAFMRMLYAYRHQRGCLFVTAPDAVGDAAETRYLWQWWAPVIRTCGHTPAFVAQDGIELAQIPWPDHSNHHNPIALFIGGSTKFKESQLVQSLIGTAKAKGIWAHVGRVNGKRRYEMMLKAGADSIDGTGFTRFPDTNVPLIDEWHREIRQQPELQESC